MSTRVTLTANQSAYLSETIKDLNEHAEEVYGLRSQANQLAISFNAPSNSYKYKTIESAVLEIYMNGYKQQQYDGLCVKTLSTAFDEATATYTTVNKSILSGGGANLYDFDLTSAYRTISGFQGFYAAMLVKHGAVLYEMPRTNSSSYVNVYTSRSANPPKLHVTFSDTNNALTIKSTTPAAGARLNRAKDNAFSVTTGADGYSFNTPAIESGIFRWREHGGTNTHEIATSGGSLSSVSIPAGTLPGGSIDYQFELVSTSGNTVCSDWVTVSLEDTLSSAKAVSPSETIVDGDKPVLFSWQHINASGAAQTGADIQISLDGSAWDTLATVESEFTQYAAPAGSIASGTWYWRVRTYNLDGAAGSWSDPIRFMAVSSPTTPVILILSASPRPEIQWQTSEQTAYQLELPGILASSSYGPGKTWRCPTYLEDGSYTVRIRSQNIYGLWSNWGEAELTVENAAGAEIQLSVEASHEAALVWDGSGYDFYIVYRNGLAIAKTTEHTYTDSWSIGETSYQVRGCYSGADNYGISAEVSTVIEPVTVMIAPVDTGEWLALGMSDSQHRVSKKKISRTITSMQIAGRKYPVEVPTEFYTESLSVSCAFSDRSAGDQLENLLGRLVCLKVRDDMVIGYLSSMTKATNEFYATYDLTVQQSDFREEINLDD